MLSNGQIDSEPLSEEEKEEVEVELDALEVNLMMIWRLMGSKMQALDKTQRKNIFHTRCSIQGKICSLIVDGGSCMMTFYASAPHVRSNNVSLRTNIEPTRNN